VQYAKSRTDAPELYHYYTAISVCAAALTDRVFVEADYGRIYPAMWIALIGESKFRKTTAISLATRLLKRADQELELPQTFSAEAIIEHLSHRPYGLLRWGEMGVGLEFLSKDYASGIISSLVQLWDGEGMTRLTKEGGATNIDHAALSILAAGKRQWFLRYAKDKRNVAMGVGTGFFGAGCSSSRTRRSRIAASSSAMGRTRTRTGLRPSRWSITLLHSGSTRER